MAVPLPKYIKVKDRYCIAYYGNCDEYILQLLYLRSAIEKELPGIEIYISCKDKLIKNQKRMIPFSQTGNIKKEIAYIKQLKCNLKSHPVLDLINESSLTLKYLEYPALKHQDTKSYALYPKGCLPTQSLSEEEISKIKKFLASSGWKETDSPSWVIGVENYDLFDAAIKGIKTSLIPTGLGTKLYQLIFPQGEIFNLNHI
jgi:hypothetical protein